MFSIGSSCESISPPLARTDVVEKGCRLVELVMLVRLLGGMLPPVLLLLMLNADADNEESATRCSDESFGRPLVKPGRATTMKARKSSVGNLLRPCRLYGLFERAFFLSQRLDNRTILSFPLADSCLYLGSTVAL